MDSILLPLTDGSFNTPSESCSYILSCIRLCNNSKIILALEKYLFLISTSNLINTGYLQGYHTAISLLSLSRRKCCIKLCISPHSSKTIVERYVRYIAFYGVEGFVDNYYLEISRKTRINKLQLDQLTI